MRFFGTRSAAEADSYWHRHRPELLPKRGFGDWKLTVSALALAGVANVIGALFAPEGDDENVATSGYSGATLPKNSTQAAHDKVVSSEEQSIDFAQAPLDNISSPGAAAPASGAAQPPAGVSGGTPVVATVNTPVAAPPIAAPPPTASQFPDPKTVRAAASLGPDGTPIATRPSSDTDSGKAAQASDAAEPPAKPAPKAPSETGAIAQPSTPNLESPTKLTKRVSAHVVARTDTTSPSAAMETSSQSVQLRAPAKPKKAARAAPKARQAAAEPQAAPQAATEPQAAPQAAAEPQAAPQAAAEPQAAPQAPRRPAGR